jgi:serine phosphatase RsbU (regulator of sigma subunit)
MQRPMYDFASMRLPFQSTAPASRRHTPAPSHPPQLANTSVAALYRGARVGGDFFDFVPTPSGHLLFLLLDVAGRREGAFEIAAAAQGRLRTLGPERFKDSEANESIALTELALELNRSIMQAADGVRCAPAFLGCYQPALGMVWYLNAGHTPGLLRDSSGVATLEANGLPLGLFSHATHDAQVCVLQPGASLLLVSKGLVEARSGATEFGLERVRDLFSKAQVDSADDLCQQVLESNDSFIQTSTVSRFSRGAREPNDRTAIAILRTA